MTSTEEFLTRQQAADRAGVDVRTIDRWLGKSLTTYEAAGRHRIRVSRNELDQLITPTAR